MKYFLALGTNLGDLEQNLLTALEKISQISDTTITKKSSMYPTKAWGLTDQNDFLNMAIEIVSKLTPHELLKSLQDIEKQMGRVKVRKWGERIIDLDILFCENKIVETETLLIPHPYLHQRDFVLQPMMEIAPDFVHPVINKTIKEIKKNNDK